MHVAIIGYGPVGKLLAILLAQRGWRVGVFEKWPSAFSLPRAVHFDHEVARILQSAGVMDEIAARSEPADVYEWRNGAGEILLRLGRPGAQLAASGWWDSTMFCQPELERVLDRRLRALPNVELHLGHELVGLEQSAHDVELRVVAGDRAERRVRAAYAVGCDGANSFVREAVRLATTDLGFCFDWLIVDLIPNQPRAWSPLNVQVCDPARPTTAVSGGPGRRRWEFMRLPGERSEDLNRAETAWKLLQPWGMSPDNAQLERHAVYTFRARFVDEWRRGRVFVAGDAAHQMPPFAGQGMCSGLRDAANLAWKLDLVLGGKASARLFDSYASERLPHVRQAIDFSVGLGRIICVPDPAAAAERDAAMIPAARDGRLTVPPPLPGLGAGIVHAGDAHAGRLFVQGRVTQRGRTGRFDDVVGRGWVLLGRRADPLAELDADLAAWFASIGGIGAHVAESGPLVDVDRTYANWFAGAGVELVLQRPDFYLFGTATDAVSTNELVRALRDALT
jgi:flavoprotein hydroxylase